MKSWGRPEWKRVSRPVFLWRAMERGREGPFASPCCKATNPFPQLVKRPVFFPPPCEGGASGGWGRSLGNRRPLVTPHEKAASEFQKEESEGENGATKSG